MNIMFELEHFKPSIQALTVAFGQISFFFFSLFNWTRLQAEPEWFSCSFDCRHDGRAGGGGWISEWRKMSSSECHFGSLFL